MQGSLGVGVNLNKWMPSDFSDFQAAAFTLTRQSSSRTENELGAAAWLPPIRCLMNLFGFRTTDERSDIGSLVCREDGMDGKVVVLAAGG